MTGIGFFKSGKKMVTSKQADPEQNNKNSGAAGSHIIRHDLKMTLQKHGGLLFLALLLFLVLIPFSTAGIPGDSIFEITTTHEQLKYRFIKDSFFLPVYAGILVYGVVLGISVFSFLLKKEQITFYFSLGLSRSKLYLVRIFICFLGMAAAVWIPMTVSLALNLAALGNYTGMIVSYVYVSAGLFLQGMTVCLINAAACILAGTIRETLLFDLLFLGTFSAVVECADRLLQHLVWGNSIGAVSYSGTQEYAAPLFSSTEKGNPLLFFWDNLRTYSLFYREPGQAAPDSSPVAILIGWGIVCLCLLMLGLVFIRKKKAEQAGMEGQYRFLYSCFLFVAGLTLSGNVFTLFSDSSLLTASFLSGFSLLLFFILWQRIGWGMVREDVRPVRESAGILLRFVAVAATAGVFVLVSELWMRQLPENGTIETASVSYVGHPSYLYGDIAGSSSSNGYYMSCMYDYTNENDIATVLQLHKSMIAMGKQKKQTNTDQFEKTVVPYDICFSYTMANGKKKVYYYDRASLKILEEMLVLDDSGEVKEKMAAVIEGDDTSASAGWAAEAYQSGDLYLSDIWFTHPYKLTMSEEGRAELLQALAEDVQNQSVQDRYFPEKEALGVLFFTADGENDLETFSYHLGNAVIYLTDSFTNTLAFLEKNQLTSCMEFDGTVESITLQAYEPYGGINGRKTPLSNLFLGYRADSLDDFLVQMDFGNKTPITDKDRIASLLPRLRSTYNMTRAGYLAAVKIEGRDGYIYKYLPGGLEE